MVVVDKVVEKVITKGVSEDKVRELQEQALKAKQELQLKHHKEKEEIRALTAQLANRTESMAKTVCFQLYLCVCVEAGVKDLIRLVITSLCCVWLFVLCCAVLCYVFCTQNEQLAKTVADKQKERQTLRAALREVEAKITKGAELVSAAEQQRLALAQTKAETHARKLEAERVARELAERQDEQASLTEKYESQEKEVAAKRKKLSKLQEKFQELKGEIDDLHGEQQREREDLLEEIRNYTRHIQLMDMLLEHFVPKPEHEKVKPLFSSLFASASASAALLVLLVYTCKWEEGDRE